MIEKDAQHLAMTIGGGPQFAAAPVTIAAMSIAISMKRIADAIEGVPYDTSTGADNSRHRAGLVDAIGTAIEQGILAAGQRG